MHLFIHLIFIVFYINLLVSLFIYLSIYLFFFSTASACWPALLAGLSKTLEPRLPPIPLEQKHDILKGIVHVH